MAVSESGVLPKQSTVARFDELADPATPVAGGKGASLSRMSRFGLPVPPGFVVCADAFRKFLDPYGGPDLVRKLTASLDVHNEHALNGAAAALQGVILSRAMPANVVAEIRAAYSELASELGAECPVAVRSSAVSEDGDVASFAGQQETFLNVRGPGAVVKKVQECWASFFSPRAMFYRAQKGDLADTQIAVVVQAMVFAEKSGVMFTIDPVQNRESHMVVEAVFGLGEGVVSGAITPDHYALDRDDGSVFHEVVAVKTAAIVHDAMNGGVRHIEIPEEQSHQRVLKDSDLAELWKIGLRIEEFFGRPQDVEWAIQDGRLFLLQSRPITTAGGTR